VIAKRSVGLRLITLKSKKISFGVDAAGESESLACSGKSKLMRPPSLVDRSKIWIAFARQPNNLNFSKHKSAFLWNAI
jgi:hypothetical protein